MPFTQVTVTGTFKSSGVAQSGQVVFQLSADLQDGAGQIVPAIPKTATLDVNGHFSIVLDAVDDPTTTPAGQVYACTKYVVGEAPATVRYTIGRGVNPVDIAQLTPQQAAVPNYPVLRKDSGSVNAFNLGVTGTLDPSLGYLQRVTLTAPHGVISGVVNLPSGQGCDFWVEVVQDNVGGRYVTWPNNFQFPGGAVPALTQKAGSVDRFHVVTSDAGSTFQVDGGISSFAGVDPSTIPTCVLLYEAVSQPQALNSLANTTMYDRFPTWRAALNAARNGTQGFDLRDGWVPTKPLTADFAGGRRMMDISPYGGSTQFIATLGSSLATWTVIYSREQLDNTNNAGAGVEVQTGSGKMGLRTNAGGNPFFSGLGGASSYSNLAANQFTARHIIAETWDGTTGRLYYGDDAGIAFAAQTPTSGPNPWTSTTITALSINTNDSSPFNSKNRFGGIAAFSGVLDFSGPNTQGTLAARWIAALAGITV